MAPQIISRAGWGARPPKSAWTHWPSGQPTGTTYHWEGAGGHQDHAFCAAEVRSIQLFHMNGEYIDIAYNWLVCIHGVVFEGRPLPYESAAQRDGNRTHVAVCFMWGPSFGLHDAAKSAGAYLYHPSARLGHRDEPSCSTSCPGDDIEAWVRLGAPSPALPVPVPHPAPAPKPLPPQGVSHPTLREGNTGSAVYELQLKLNFVSNAGLTGDGRFGPHTLNAVIAFQHFFHLVPDGIVGPKTWNMLDYCFALKQ